MSVVESLLFNTECEQFGQSQKTSILDNINKKK